MSIPWGTGSARSSMSLGLPNGNLSSSTSWNISATGGLSLSLWSYATPLPKRQGLSATQPVCVRRYGDVGASAGCRCFDLPTPEPTTTTRTVIDPSTTITSTKVVSVRGTAGFKTSTDSVQVEGTTSFIPMETATGFTTSTKMIRFTTTSTTSVSPLSP